MTQLMIRSFPALLTLALTLPLAAMAQETAGDAAEESVAPEEPMRWYKVELLVFANQSSGAAQAEQWEATPRLDYPERARFLIDEELYARRAADFKADSRTDPLGRQVLSDRGEYQLAGGAAPGQEQAQDGPALPQPWLSLPPEQREFRDKARRMDRGGRYRVLYHESWVQPMQEEALAVPMALDRSGDEGTWPQLQGSIKLHLSRYLHLQADLWLNTTGDYLPGNWQMPAPPLGPVSLVGDELDGFEEQLLAMQEAAAPARPVAPAATPYPGPTSASQGTPIPGLPTGLPDANGDPYGEPAGMNAVVELEDPGPVYPWRHAVVLQQNRRMRSNEVHYIDHPMLGMLIKLTPMAREDLEQLSANLAGNQG